MAHDIAITQKMEIVEQIAKESKPHIYRTVEKYEITIKLFSRRNILHLFDWIRKIIDVALFSIQFSSNSISEHIFSTDYETVSQILKASSIRRFCEEENCRKFPMDSFLDNIVHPAARKFFIPE